MEAVLKSGKKVSGKAAALFVKIGIAEFVDTVEAIKDESSFEPESLPEVEQVVEEIEAQEQTVDTVEEKVIEPEIIESELPEEVIEDESKVTKKPVLMKKAAPKQEKPKGKSKGRPAKVKK